MRSRWASETLLWLIGAAGIAVIAVVQTTVFYRASPMIGIALPIAAGVAALVIAKPMVGACLGIAAVPLEILHTQISPMEGLLLLTAGAVLLRWAFGAARLRIDPVFMVFGAALLWMLAGLGVARDEFIVVRTLLMWASFAMVALFISNATPKQVRMVLWAIVAGAVFTALIAVASGTAQEARAGATAVEGRAQGSFTHPAQLAFFLVMALPPALVLIVKSRAWLRVLAAAAAVVIITVLVLTLTRGAIIGAGASLAIMLVWAPFRKVVSVVLVALLLFAVLNADAISRSEQLNLVGARLATITNKDEATVNNNRLKIYSTVPRISADHPVFGLGVGNFKDWSLYYGLSEGGLPFEHAHNVALTVLVEQGIPGALLLLAMLFLLFRVASEALRQRRHPDFGYALAPIAGLGGLFVNSLLDYPPGSNPNMALLLIEIGLLVATARALQRPPT
ncbi:MAG: O-antigen ligase family protein [Solirubrobacteraceae bacterium]